MKVVMYQTIAQSFEVRPGSLLEQKLADSYDPETERVNQWTFKDNINSNDVTPLSEPHEESDETEVVRTGD